MVLNHALDTIFNPNQFRNEIVWKRTFAHGSAKRYGPVHDIILFYSKADDFLWTNFRQATNDEYLEEHFKMIDSTSGRRFQPISLTGAGIRRGESGKPWRGIDPTSIGRHWALPGKIVENLGIQAQTTQEKLDALDQAGLIYWPQKKDGTPRLKHFADEVAGASLPDIWVDIPPISAQATERLGYPTQKPIALLERIISASSNPGDIVLDPFCGCGTAIAAAQKLERKWIGIDVTHLSIALMKYRLEAMFPGITFKVKGEPTDLGAARKLAQDDRYQFQWWALSLIRAKPLGGQDGSREGKKGSDKGIDGVIAFIDDAARKAKRVLVQVKSGHVKSGDIRDLRGTIEREKAAIGVFITLEEPSRDMKTEAVKAGFYYSDGWHKDYPRIQILTIDELLHGASVQMPPQFGTFKQAQKVQQFDAEQQELGFG